MPKLWAVNYQPVTGERVYFSSEDTETTAGRAAVHAHIDAALQADATQIGMLLDLLGGAVEV